MATNGELKQKRVVYLVIEYFQSWQSICNISTVAFALRAWIAPQRQVSEADLTKHAERCSEVIDVVVAKV